MRELIKVPHSEIKAKLEAEKADKSRKRSNSEKNSKPVARIAKKDH
jgi:hypothetical protein